MATIQHETRAVQEPRVWAEAVHDLISAYCGVDRRSLHLPALSLRPTLTFYIKSLFFEGAIILDLALWALRAVLTLVCNLVLAPARLAFRGLGRTAPAFMPWPRMFLWSYVVFVARWLWRGEVILTYPYIMRALVRPLLVYHFRRRLELIRHCIVLDGQLHPEDKESLCKAINSALDEWPSLHLFGTLCTIGLPALALIPALSQWVTPGKSPPAAAATLLIWIGAYVMVLLVPAFVVKRGLMLGLAAPASWLPGAQEGCGAYGVERRVFASIGLSRREFPLDIALFIVSLLILGVAVGAGAYGINREDPYALTGWLILCIPFFVLSVLALYRREHLVRL